jgi:maleylpyruvate isomerase
MTLILHNYFRSSTSFRVRAALNLKGLRYVYRSYPLRDGAHRSEAHLRLNPQGLVPTLETPDGPLTQSLAIIEWLDETHPEPPLLPKDPWGRARVRSLAHAIALDIHPINNLRVLAYLRDSFDADDAAVARWFRHFASETFAALEVRLSTEPQTGTFCHGETIGLADLCLVGQALNNRRFDVPSAPYPTINRIVEAALAIAPVRAAAPDRQPDAT